MVDSRTMASTERPAFKHGLVVGKFYPPHRGHKHLIETAIKNCSRVTVILIFQEDEYISPYLRGNWLREIHQGKNLDIVIVEYPKGVHPDDSRAWAEHTITWLGGTSPDAVFTSEDYGDPYASYLGAVHVLVDKGRITVPISATLVRSNPLKYAEYLEPVVKAFFARRVAIVGAESTGKTTISRALAKHYGTSWVPEFGRFYAEGKYTGSNQWFEKEFFSIAQGQRMLEDRLAESCNGLLICDTDVLATSIWFERYLGYSSDLLMLEAKTGKYDLYFLGGLDVPWTDDGTRDGNEEVRRSMHAKFINYFNINGLKWIELTGPHEQRMKQATDAIDSWVLNV